MLKQTYKILEQLLEFYRYRRLHSISDRNQFKIHILDDNR